MENKINSKKDRLVYGSIFGLYSALLMYFGYKLSLDASIYYRIINYLFAIAIIYYAINKFKTENKGFLNISDAIKMGLAIGLIGGIIYAIYTYFHLSFINKEFLPDMVESIKASKDTQGREMTSEEIKETKKVAISFMGSPFFYSTLNLIGSVFQGLIISLVIGLIKKK